MERIVQAINDKDIVIPRYKEYSFGEKMAKYCLLIPVFNEGERFVKQLENMLEQELYKHADIIICDAGSKDGSTDPVLLQRMHVMALLVREGDGRYSADIKMGYWYALEKGYEGFITVDGNGKDDTSALPLFVQKLEEGCDYVQGSRYIPGGQGINTPFIRHWALKLINEPIMSLMGKRRLTDSTNGFRAYSKKAILDDRVKPFRKIFYGYELIYYLPVRCSSLKMKCQEVPVTRSYPHTGEVPSKIGGIKGYIYQMKILFNILRNRYNP